jgi:hypothetical protein
LKTSNVGVVVVMSAPAGADASSSPSPPPSSSSSYVWSFGFGSNMNVAFVESKKGYKVHAHRCAVLRGWRLTFNLHGPDRVEESFANAQPSEDPADEIHGVAIKLTVEDALKLDAQERAYRRVAVVVRAYDGTEIEAHVYSKEQVRSAAHTNKSFSPTARFQHLIAPPFN